MPPKVHTVEFGSLTPEHQFLLVAPDYQYMIKGSASEPPICPCVRATPARTGLSVWLRLQTADMHMQTGTSEAEPHAFYITVLPLRM